MSWFTEDELGDNLNSITFADNKFVAVGSNSRILTSIDGETWSPVIIAADHINGITEHGHEEKSTQKGYRQSHGDPESETQLEEQPHGEEYQQ